MNRAETGRRGEAAAARWYQKQGCRLLAHNFHTRMGELDVVVQEPDGTIVICEVKTRAEGSLASPAEAVDRPKPVSYTHLTLPTCSTVLSAAERPERCTGAI